MRKTKFSILLLSLSAALTFPAATARAAGPGDMVVPVGRAVGIQVDCDGVLVSALAEVETPEGTACPAKEAGIAPGDRITALNGEPVATGEEFLAMTKALTGEPVELRAVHRGKSVTVTVNPCQGPGGAWQLGLWLRPGVRGVGTVTFWDPATGEFGALGHAVSLPETGELFPLSRGVITAAAVSEVVPGRIGEPGELCAAAREDAVLGRVEENSERGIFGVSVTALGDADPVPVAGENEIALGAAVILSTVDESGPREFSAEITRIARGEGAGRQLTISVTDPALLSRTGGIVQGMSGSPILQNGKLVGAVTHVLVSDPSKGYGITMENMLRRTGELAPAA